MKKTIFATVSMLITCIFLPQISLAHTPWPATFNSEVGGSLPSAYEPSGTVYHSRLNRIYVISDDGRLAYMNTDGSGVTSKTVGGDNEGLTIANESSNYLYIGIEQPDSIIEVTTEGVATGKSWNLTNWMTGADNAGLEGLTFVPNGYHSYADSASGGLFYASLQATGEVFVFDVNLSTSGTVTLVDSFTPYAAAGSDTADLFFSKQTGMLYVLYDSTQFVAEINPRTKTKIVDYTPVPDLNEEGIMLIYSYPSSTASLYLANDADGSITKYTGYPVSYLDSDSDGTPDYSEVSSYTYYRDADGDGYGNASITNTSYSATPTNGYVINNTDCNDSSVSTYQNLNVYNDVDGDGYGTGTIHAVCSGASTPSGHSINNTDCNDNDAAVNTNQIYYRDADGDGLGLLSSTTSVCSMTMPTGYVVNHTDSNDNDYDNDGVEIGTDCNDHDVTLTVNHTYYRDADGDTYGTSTGTIFCANSAPSGYVINNTDCDDSQAALNILESYPHYYLDHDGDGYGVSNVVTRTCSFTPPTGYAANFTDCNDYDSAANTFQNFYLDNDQDGYGSSTSVSICSSATPGNGYSLNSSDCDDNNNTVFTNTTFYKDHDGDGLGNINDAVTECALTKSGYVNNGNDVNDNDYDNDTYETNNDCNDRDSAIWMNQVYFQDYDGDGLGNPAVTQSICSLSVPTGYVTNGNDLNDNDATNTVPPVEQPILVISLAGRYIYINNQRIKIFDEKPKSVDYEVVNYYEDNMTEIIVVGLFGNRATIVTLQVNNTDYSAKIVKKEVIRFQQKRTTMSLKTKEHNHRFITRFDHKKITWKIKKTANFVAVK